MSRAQVEALLDELLGGWPWRSWDTSLSLALDAALGAEEAAA
jgi:hypothetical protein